MWRTPMKPSFRFAAWDTPLRDTELADLRHCAQMQLDSALRVILHRPCPALCRVSTQLGKAPAGIRGLHCCCPIGEMGTPAGTPCVDRS
jgi:hypothetical protein